MSCFSSCQLDTNSNRNDTCRCIFDTNGAAQQIYLKHLHASFDIVQRFFVRCISCDSAALHETQRIFSGASVFRPQIFVT